MKPQAPKIYPIAIAPPIKSIEYQINLSKIGIFIIWELFGDLYLTFYASSP